MRNLLRINRKQGTIILPSDVYDKIISEGKYLTCNSRKRTYGKYVCVMVCKKEKNKLVYRQALARVILDAPANKHVDHIDKNPLNNSVDNLRLVSQSENSRNRLKSANTSMKYYGVCKKKKYYANIKVFGISFSARNLSTEEEAAHAYNLLSKIFHGEFGTQNKIPTKKPRWVKEIENAIKK